MLLPQPFQILMTCDCFLSVSSQVVVTYPSQQKSKVIKDKGLVTILKALADGASNKRLAGIIYRHNELRTALHQLVCSRLSSECTALCGNKDPSVLQMKTTDDLATIDWNVVIQEWQQRSTLLYSVLQAVAAKVHVKAKEESPGEAARHQPCIGLAGSVLLFHRNPKMCRLQLAIGMVLDKGGTTDEVHSGWHFFIL